MQLPRIRPDQEAYTGRRRPRRGTVLTPCFAVSIIESRSSCVAWRITIRGYNLYPVGKLLSLHAWRRPTFLWGWEKFHCRIQLRMRARMEHNAMSQSYPRKVIWKTPKIHMQAWYWGMLRIFAGICGEGSSGKWQIIAVVSRDHFLELTNHTGELALSSTGSTSQAPELVRVNLRASYYIFSFYLFDTGSSGPIQLITWISIAQLQHKYMRLYLLRVEVSCVCRKIIRLFWFGPVNSL